MDTKTPLIRFNDITMTLSADGLKAALIAKYGDTAAQILVDGLILQNATYSTYCPDDGVTFAFTQPLEGRNTRATNQANTSIGRMMAGASEK
ncbi:hypothetical protein AYK59_19015 [Pseudomonas synxantha]|uniref:hypothetical protein n=1 Tax=Pseudomonas synxantha TaxID=47883 RepID=UPI00078D5C12|nr:hypothetical protein [Pseudomonas synxantha]AMS22121.1 hypothetical protein AYK59_19015 [Pseudomonas synxantha]